MTPEADLKRFYARAHRRVTKLWGKASQYACIECGRPAKDWAYDGTDPSDPSNLGDKWRYSNSPEFYMPMCHACHMGRDRDIRGAWQKMPPVLIGTPPCRHPEGCQRPAYRSRLCKLHYRRRLRYGGLGPVDMIGKHAPLKTRFFNNVQIYGPLPTPNVLISPQEAVRLGACSVWTGYVHASGYGAIWRGHRLLYVHRVAWEMTYGPIPPRGVVFQLCCNPLCVRVDHLQMLRDRR